MLSKPIYEALMVSAEELARNGIDIIIDILQLCPRGGRKNEKACKYQISELDTS